MPARRGIVISLLPVFFREGHVSPFTKLALEQSLTYGHCRLERVQGESCKLP